MSFILWFKSFSLSLLNKSKESQIVLITIDNKRATDAAKASNGFHVDGTVLKLFSLINI